MNKDAAGDGPNHGNDRPGIWPTLFAPFPMEESDRALEAAGTNGVAIYAALHKLRFLAPREHRSAFFCSEAQIARYSGLSPRRLRDPLRALEGAGIVRIVRPVGAARLCHEASKITLLPIVVTGNKVGDRRDKSSGPARTSGPVANGPEPTPKMSVIRESPLKGDDSSAPACGLPSGSPRGRDESSKSATQTQTW
jgi:hypothetical protein